MSTQLYAHERMARGVYIGDVHNNYVRKHARVHRTASPSTWPLDVTCGRTRVRDRVYTLCLSVFPNALISQVGRADQVVSRCELHAVAL